MIIDYEIYLVAVVTAVRGLQFVYRPIASI